MIGHLFTTGCQIDADWQQVELFVPGAACEAKKWWLIPMSEGKGELAPQRERLGFAEVASSTARDVRERLGRRL
jgi:hypothetical protein